MTCRQGDILGPLADHVYHLKVVVDVLLLLIAVLNQVDALLDGHIIEEHRVIAGDDIQHMGVIIADDFIQLILLAEAVYLGDDVPQLCREEEMTQHFSGGSMEK